MYTILRVTTLIYAFLAIAVPAESLFLYNNTFDGPIVSEFGSLANLTQLRLYGNVLTGAIPEEIFDATKLRVLRVDRNFLGGGLSTNIGKLVELEDLRMNLQFPPGFTGSVPEELSQCSLLSKWQSLLSCLKWVD